MCQATDRYVTKRTRGELSRSVLRTSDCFLDVIVLPFLSLVLGKDLVGPARNPFLVDFKALPGCRGVCD